MTARPVIMTGLAFTLGIVVGLLSRLPGTTSPSVYRRGIGEDGTFSPRTLYNLRFQRIDRSDSVQRQQPATADDAVFFPNTPVESSDFKQRSGITRMIPEPRIISQSLKDRVNTDYNDKGFIQSRKNPPVNMTDPVAAAVIAFPDREKVGSLFSAGASSTGEYDGNGEDLHLKSRILSVLQDIKVVQLERNNILDDIAAKQIKAGMMELWGSKRNLGQDATSRTERNVDIEFKKTRDQTSNILSQKPGKPQTPIDNKIEDVPSSRSNLGSRSKGFRPRPEQTHTGPVPVDHPSKPVDIVDGGVFWAEELENLCPCGFPDQMYRSWKEKIVKTNVVGIDEGCGRMQNRLLTFQDSSRACARYRPNTDQIQGEIYSYHLGKLLGINNVPPSVLASVQNGDPRWNQVGKEVAMSQWGEDKLIVLTRWVEDLQPAYIPEEMRYDNRKLYPNDIKLLNKSLSDLCELVQWSDLIIFDYLTANLDRIVNNMFNQQWNSQMMTYPAHNLHKIKDSNTLVFLDNESGLFHGYRLLDKYSMYHTELLKSLCIFRTSTARAVEKLLLDDNIEEELRRTFASNEPHSGILPDIPAKNVDILKLRLKDVYEQIQTCHRQFQN